MTKGLSFIGPLQSSLRSVEWLAIKVERSLIEAVVVAKYVVLGHFAGHELEQNPRIRVIELFAFPIDRFRHDVEGQSSAALREGEGQETLQICLHVRNRQGMAAREDAVHDNVVEGLER